MCCFLVSRKPKIHQPELAWHENILCKIQTLAINPKIRNPKSEFTDFGLKSWTSIFWRSLADLVRLIWDLYCWCVLRDDRDEFASFLWLCLYLRKRFRWQKLHGNTTSHHQDITTKRNCWRLVRTKNSVWAAHWLVALHVFYSQTSTLPHPGTAGLAYLNFKYLPGSLVRCLTNMLVKIAPLPQKGVMVKNKQM